MPDGELMNRYWDDNAAPRQESYREDRETAERRTTNLMIRMRFASKEAADDFRAKTIKETYSHLRAGAASGWDFSSRWFDDGQNIETIETANFIPVDLNSLLYFYENLLSRIYAQAGNKQKTANYLQWSKEREAAINKYCWNAGQDYYCDYRFDLGQTSDAVTAAGMFPLCFFDPKSYNSQIEGAANNLKRYLLKAGGVLSTPINSGQQWDAPNGWAPLQWMTVWAMDRCGKKELAKDIATRWVNLNKAVYARTGKLLEKYNVVDTRLESGGGEYPTQDGFGWTNGVALALIRKYGLQGPL
jgi:alpha,alpha-trehalase